jgi:hypothetical protein
MRHPGPNFTCLMVISHLVRILIPFDCTYVILVYLIIISNKEVPSCYKCLIKMKIGSRITQLFASSVIVSDSGYNLNFIAKTQWQPCAKRTGYKVPL